MKAGAGGTEKGELRRRGWQTVTVEAKEDDVKVKDEKTAWDNI